MDMASPAASWTLFWTITRAVALAVLATEAVFLLRRARHAHPEPTTASRFFWAVTPALLVAGLSFWCLAALPSPRALRATAIADASSHTQR